jgi:hypothetical protein
MATRFYLLQSSAFVPSVSPPFAAGWNDTGGAVRRKLDLQPDRADSFVEFSRSEAVTTSPYDVLLGQWVSAPLSGAQTISGTLKGQIRARESSSSADFRAQVVVKIVSNDGQTLRGTLLGFDTGALSSEFATSSTNRQFPRGGAVALSSVAAQDGDRIVIEVGYRSHNTVSTSYTGYIEVGAPSSASGDLPEDETTTTQLRPWLEFSQTLTLQPAQHRTTLELAQVVARDPSPEHRTTLELAQVVARDPNPEHRTTMFGAHVAARDPNPEHRITLLVAQVMMEEYDYGWGVQLEGSED